MPGHSAQRPHGHLGTHGGSWDQRQAGKTGTPRVTTAGGPPTLQPCVDLHTPYSVCSGGVPETAPMPGRGTACAPLAGPVTQPQLPPPPRARTGSPRPCRGSDVSWYARGPSTNPAPRNSLVGSTQLRRDNGQEQPCDWGGAGQARLCSQSEEVGVAQCGLPRPASLVLKA